MSQMCVGDKGDKNLWKQTYLGLAFVVSFPEKLILR